MFCFGGGFAAFYQLKYEELLQRCQQATEQLSHKAVQTANSPLASVRARRRLSASSARCDLAAALEDGQQPEYKALFNEIFTCIQKTRADVHDDECPVKDGRSQTSAE